ncbi:hypothetical protein E2C01_083749 [Portunus trituberculatus]|uniref:Uncharacterized protein n=1 Tax=Portunus trituberculatus TaxID=210409 RepID=A0A5B7J7D4_PORTR|nr:hypothetical protein [Portunus trituberculatus]
MRTTCLAGEKRERLNPSVTFPACLDAITTVPAFSPSPSPTHAPHLRK